MNRTNTVTLKNRAVALSAIVAVLLLIGAPGLSAVQAQTAAPGTPTRPAALNLSNQLRATVSVTDVSHSADGTAFIGCSGSGTVVSADGLILTNAHLVRPGAKCPVDQILIGLPVVAGEAPVATYYADLVEVNVGWDLAVLRIARTLDGRAVNSGTLALPYVALGDSDTLKLDDTLIAIGYPGGSDPTITSNVAIQARGTINNFLDEALVGAHAWIKIANSNRMPGGLSGGGAYNDQGQLVGIATVAPSPDQPQACRTIQDTNGDGRVDGQDACVPVAGTITQLRPSNLARGLVRAAQLNLSVTSSDAITVSQTATGTPKISRLLFAPGLNAAGMPNTILSHAPSGTKALYLFFDYDQMTDGLIYEVRTAIDGVPSPLFSLAPGTWSGGQQGLWYIGSNAQTWPNGTYTFSILINGQLAASSQIAVGGGAPAEPSFSDLLFGVPDVNNSQLILTGDVMAAQGTVYAQFVYSNMPTQATWREKWYYNGAPIAETTDQPWKDGVNGTKQVTAAAKNPLLPGRYRLEIYLNQALATTADFVMAGVQQAEHVQIFDKLAFASDVKGDVPQGTNTAFSAALNHLYATFSWQNLAPGTPWTWQLLVDGNLLFEQTQPWADPKAHTLAWLELSSNHPLPDGSYSLRISVAGVAVGSATTKVGLGQLPLNLFAQPVGVQLEGTVMDSSTDLPIAGATVIVLNSAFATADFTGQLTQIDELLSTDSQGHFQLSHLLTPGNTYSMLIRAQGYSGMATDALNVDDKTPNPLLITIQMSRG